MMPPTTSTVTAKILVVDDEMDEAHVARRAPGASLGQGQWSETAG
jgi:hypothetical protein